MGRRRPETLQESVPALASVLRRLWPYLRRRKGQIFLSTTCLIAAVLFKLLEPWPLKFIVDRIAPVDTDGKSDAATTTDRFLADVPTEQLIAGAAVAIVVIVGFRALTQYLNTVGFARLGNQTLADVRRDLFHHLQDLSLSFHTKARSGDLIIRVINDINLLRDAAVTAILPIAVNVLVFMGMWTVMFFLEWRLALLALAVLPLLSMRTIRLSRRIRDAARKQRRRQGAMANTAAESLTAIHVVQALALEKVFSDRFVARSNAGQKEDVKAARLTASLGRSVDVLLAVATGLVLWYGAILVLDGKSTIGELIVFLAYLRRAFNPVQDFAKYTGRIAKAAAAGERVLDLFDQQPDIRDKPDARVAPTLRGDIRCEGIAFRYDTDRRVLENINLQIAPGQRVAVTGPSGAGKSTLVSLLLRLYDVQDGRILVDGTDVRDLTRASLRGQMSVVLQDTVLFAGTLRENIAYGDPVCTPAEVEDAVDLAGLREWVNGLPAGLETIVGERGLTVSGGQRQRIAIARAAVRDAPILLLDEPVTGLDRATRSAVAASLEELAEGRTTVVVSHDLSLCQGCDEILYLQDGHIAERGNHEELLRADGRYAGMFAMQTALADTRHPVPNPQVAP